METILSSRSLSPFKGPKTCFPKSAQPRPNHLVFTKPVNCSIRKQDFESESRSCPKTRSWLTNAQQGLAALALTLALNFCPVLTENAALASEFDVINDGPPQESYVVDDAGVLSRVTRSDLKRLLSDLESRKNFHINFVTVRKLTVCFWSSKFLLWTMQQMLVPSDTVFLFRARPMLLSMLIKSCRNGIPQLKMAITRALLC